MTNLVIQDGIGYIQTGNQLVSATPAEYVAEIERLSSALRTANANHERFEREWYLRGDEIERLQRDLAAARLLLDERIALVHPLTDEPGAEPRRPNCTTGADAYGIECRDPLCLVHGSQVNRGAE